MFFMLLFSTKVFVVQSVDEYHAKIDHVLVLSDCVLVRWRMNSDCGSNASSEKHVHVPDFKIEVDVCNGQSYTFAVSPTINNVTQCIGEVAFSRSYCESVCLIRFHHNDTCWLFNQSLLSPTDYETGETNF